MSRTVALLLAAAGLVLVPGVAGAAQAQPTRSPQLAAAAPALKAADPTDIPADAVGSLTFHKYLLNGGQAGPPATGLPSEVPSDARPLAGVTFTVTRVDGVDLTTSAGWALVQQYVNGGMAQARQHLGASITSVPTAAGGVTKVADLPVGLYLVHEAGAVTASGMPDSSVVTASDFLVTVPVADPTDRDRWLYDLHVYPKNSRVGITKSVADGNPAVAGQDAPVPGSVLTYSLASDIPGDGLRSFGGRCERAGAVDTGPGRDEFGFTPTGVCASGAGHVGVAAGAVYEIVDDLAGSVVPGVSPQQRSSDFLEYAAPGWAGSVTVGLSGAGPLVPCPAGSTTSCDYVLTQSSAAVSVAMTDRGLQALAAAKAAAPAAQVQVSLHARVRPSVATATLAAPLTLPNTATLIPTGRAKAAGVSLASNAVTSIYAALRVRKVAEEDPGTRLPGAVFALYRTQADADAGRNPLLTSEPTGPDGITVFAGLHVTDFQNNAGADDSYWMVETQAPSGYALRSTPIQVRLDSDGHTPGADADGALPFADPKLWSPRGVLAFTGSHVMPVLVLGLGLIALGLVVAVLSRRRHRHEAREAA